MALLPGRVQPDRGEGREEPGERSQVVRITFYEGRSTVESLQFGEEK
jgi:hypothetical protein